MVQYTIELVIIDDRFINSTGIAALGSNITRQTIKKRRGSRPRNSQI